jgi:hypothetical protein
MQDIFGYRKPPEKAAAGIIARPTGSARFKPSASDLHFSFDTPRAVCLI